MDNRFYFFAGGDFRKGKENAFTGNFIRYLEEILGSNYRMIRGIYDTRPLVNVVRALKIAQEPVRNPLRNRIISSAAGQILSDPDIATARFHLISSSYGSVIAAQVACHLAGMHQQEKIFSQPFNVALGASLLSKESVLYRQLVYYREAGVIGNILYDELQDEGDNSNGIGGVSRLEAYANGLGICFPFLTRKFSGPSFLNKHPVTGHLHRVRAQSVEKAKDFIRTILIDQGWGGGEAGSRAMEVIGSRR